MFSKAEELQRSNPRWSERRNSFSMDRAGRAEACFGVNSCLRWQADEGLTAFLDNSKTWSMGMKLLEKKAKNLHLSHDGRCG